MKWETTGAMTRVIAPVFAAHGCAGASETTRASDIPQHIIELAGTVLAKEDRKRNATLVYVKAGANAADNGRRLADELDRLKDPNGVVLVIGSEDTRTIAKIALDAFNGAKPGHLAGCIVVFVGAASDNKLVGDAVSKSGASYRFAEFTP